MNPAALKANLRDLPRGADDHRSTPTSSPSATSPRSATPTNPLDDGSLDSYHVHAARPDAMTVEALDGVRPHPQGRRSAAKNMFALGLLSWLYTRPIERHRALPQEQVRAPSPRSSRRTSPRFEAGWNFGETTEDFAVSYEVAPGAAAAGHLPQHHRQHGARARAGRRRPPGRAAARARLVPDHPGHRHPARARRAQAVRRHDHPGRGRDRRHRHRPRRALRRRASASPRRPAPAWPSRPRRSASRSRSSCRWSSSTCSAAGRRTGPADQDRAGRPAAGDVRPQRRVAGADRGARARRPTASTPRIEAVRIATTYRTPVHAAVRRLPRQRLRAVARAGRRRPLPDLHVEFASGPTPRTPRASRASTPTCATRRRWPGRGRSPAPPGLEHRIGGIEKADVTGNISYDPDNHDQMVRLRQAKVDGIDVARRSRSTTPTGDAEVLVLGWGSTYGPIAAAARRGAQGRRPGRAGAPAPPQPVPGQPRRGAAALRGCSCRR